MLLTIQMDNGPVPDPRALKCHANHHAAVLPDFK